MSEQSGDSWDSPPRLMRFRVLSAYLGFALSAYAPLALMLGAIYLPTSWQLAVMCFVVAVLLAATVGALISRRARRIGGRRITYSGGGDLGDAVAGYLAGFLVPFLVVPTANWGVALAYLIFFALALFLHTRSRLGLINPTLYILGWRVARVTVGERTVFLLHRGSIPNSGTLIAVEFSGIYIEKKEKVK